MRKSDAKRIAETITEENLSAMFERAKKGVSDWREISAVNPGMTKGCAWNILYRGFVKGARHPVSVKNMVHEFGDFLEDSVKDVVIDGRKLCPTPHHEDPVFEVDP